MPINKLKWFAILFAALMVGVECLAIQGGYFQFLKRVPVGDKIGHFILPGILSYLINMALSCVRVRILTRGVLKGSLIVALVMTLEELSQLFLVTRQFSLYDLLFDYLGIVAFGWAAMYWTARSTKAKMKQPIGG